jgi:hypothetical protein
MSDGWPYDGRETHELLADAEGQLLRLAPILEAARAWQDACKAVKHTSKLTPGLWEAVQRKLADAETALSQAIDNHRSQDTP